MKTYTPAQIHALNAEKGFWDNPRTIEECAMLVITELSEAVDADRKGRRVKNPQEVKSRILDILSQKNFGENSFETVLFVESFEYAIKDTVEDELADACIRLYDYGAHFSDVTEMLEHNSFDALESDNSFCHQVFKITKHITEYPLAVYEAIWRISRLAVTFNIDLDFHIIAKLEYNKTRPYKHGKQY
jgi:NTP pyrophosphatase (non-canonical NTP hydrolase)